MKNHLYFKRAPRQCGDVRVTREAPRGGGHRISATGKRRKFTAVGEAVPDNKIRKLVYLTGLHANKNGPRKGPFRYRRLLPAIVWPPARECPVPPAWSPTCRYCWARNRKLRGRWVFLILYFVDADRIFECHTVRAGEIEESARQRSDAGRVRTRSARLRPAKENKTTRSTSSLLAT